LSISSWYQSVRGHLGRREKRALVELAQGAAIIPCQHRRERPSTDGFCPDAEVAMASTPSATKMATTAFAEYEISPVHAKLA
jgi:hypothetical protein